MKVLLSSLVLFEVVLSFGCAPSEPERVEVAGTVQLDGEPLTKGGTIRFVPGGGRPASSRIRPDGSFELNSSTVSKTVEGLVPGLYRVSVTSNEFPGEDMEPIWFAPAHYSDHRTSGIEIIIDEPTESLVIELVSEATSSLDGQETDPSISPPADESNVEEPSDAA